MIRLGWGGARRKGGNRGHDKEVGTNGRDWKGRQKQETLCTGNMVEGLTGARSRGELGGVVVSTGNDGEGER